MHKSMQKNSSPFYQFYHIRWHISTYFILFFQKSTDYFSPEKALRSPFFPTILYSFLIKRLNRFIRNSIIVADARTKCKKKMQQIKKGRNIPSFYTQKISPRSVRGQTLHNYCRNCKKLLEISGILFYNVNKLRMNCKRGYCAFFRLEQISPPVLQNPDSLLRS